MHFANIILRLTDASKGAVAVLFICVAIEFVATRERYGLADRWRGLLFTFIGSLAAATTAWLLQLVWTGTGLHVVIPVYQLVRPLGLAGVAISVFVSVAAYDFFAYWRHRAEHKWFWSIHALHHSPTELHAANNWAHPLSAIPGFFFLSLPVSLIQMPGPATPAAIALLISFLATYIHSPVDFDFGPFRRIVVDNRFHRIHHSIEPEHFDRNFGILFSFWDGLFGTAHWPNANEWPPVGIDRPPPKSILEFFVYPSQQLMSWRRRPAAIALVTVKSRSSLAAHVAGDVKLCCDDHDCPSSE